MTFLQRTRIKSEHFVLLPEAGRWGMCVVQPQRRPPTHAPAWDSEADLSITLSLARDTKQLIRSNHRNKRTLEEPPKIILKIYFWSKNLFWLHNQVLAWPVSWLFRILLQAANRGQSKCQSTPKARPVPLKGICWPGMKFKKSTHACF